SRRAASRRLSSTVSAVSSGMNSENWKSTRSDSSGMTSFGDQCQKQHERVRNSSAKSGSLPGFARCLVRAYRTVNRLAISPQLSLILPLAIVTNFSDIPFHQSSVSKRSHPTLSLERSEQPVFGEQECVPPQRPSWGTEQARRRRGIP